MSCKVRHLPPAQVACSNRLQGKIDEGRQPPSRANRRGTMCKEGARTKGIWSNRALSGASECRPQCGSPRVRCPHRNSRRSMSTGFLIFSTSTRRSRNSSKAGGLTPSSCSGRPISPGLRRGEIARVPVPATPRRPCSLRLMHSVVVTTNAESAQLFDRELQGLGFQLKERPWHEPRSTLIEDLCPRTIGRERHGI